MTRFSPLKSISAGKGAEASHFDEAATPRSFRVHVERSENEKWPSLVTIDWNDPVEEPDTPFDRTSEAGRVARAHLIRNHMAPRVLASEVAYLFAASPLTPGGTLVDAAAMVAIGGAHMYASTKRVDVPRSSEEKADLLHKMAPHEARYQMIRESFVESLSLTRDRQSRNDVHPLDYIELLNTGADNELEGRSVKYETDSNRRVEIKSEVIEVPYWNKSNGNYHADIEVVVDPVGVIETLSDHPDFDELFLHISAEVFEFSELTRLYYSLTRLNTNSTKQSGVFASHDYELKDVDAIGRMIADLARLLIVKFDRLVAERHATEL